MSFEMWKYGPRAHATNIVPQERWMDDAILGLTGEVGEIAEIMKKFYRDNPGEDIMDDLDMVSRLKKELGDVLWYVNEMAMALYRGGHPDALRRIMELNLDKVESRKERGKIGGSGDDR